MEHIQAISIILADDHAVVRQALRALLQGRPDLRVIGEAENGRQALALALALKPEVILMDVAMPLLNGVEATRQILQELRSAKVLALTSYSDEQCVTQMMAAGAAGFVLKQAASSELLKAIYEVHRGNAFVSRAAAKHLTMSRKKGVRGAGSREPAGAKLTPREAEVLQLVAEGFANKQIAQELGISINTVGRHRETLMAKLDIHDVAGLTRHACMQGMVGRELRPEV